MHTACPTHNLHKNKLLEIRNLTTTIGTYTVHSKLNFELYEREVFVLYGPSGSGKSTLLKALLETNSVETSGEFLWKGRVLNRSQLPMMVGFQPQSSALLSDYTVGENIAMPLIYVHNISEHLAYQLVAARIQLFQLSADLFYKYPAMLSGGERKIASFARATILDPELVILDEPASGLDPQNVELLCKAIQVIKKQSAVLCITHTPIPADRYGLLYKKQIVSGTKNELLHSTVDEIGAFARALV